MCSMRMSQDKRLLPHASSPQPPVSVTFGPESWWMSLGVVHFLPYTINLSAFDRSATCMQEFICKATRIPALLSCSHFTLFNEPGPGYCWLALSSGALHNPHAQPLLRGPSLLPGGGYGTDAWGDVLVCCFKLSIWEGVCKASTLLSRCVRLTPQHPGWTGLP